MFFNRLQNIQRKLDKSSYDKDEFKKLDLTQHRLVHDGNLTMKKNPSIQLHGLLFENMIVLLTKQVSQIIFLLQLILAYEPFTLM